MITTIIFWGIAVILLAVLDTQTIGRILGESSGFMGVLLAPVIGAITLIPGIIAFPTAALLMKGGAGYMQMAPFPWPRCS